LNVYVAIFLLYMFLPLLIMSAAAFNAYPVPSVTMWQGVTLKWFSALFADQRLIRGLLNSLLVSSCVVLLSLPLGLAGALLLRGLKGTSRGFLYAVMVSPILTPGLVLGISTLVLWRHAGVGGGLFLAVLAQTSFVAAYAMLMFAARLERSDASLNEAALDLGASHWLVFRRITLPFLAPATATAAVVAFFQSFENYNTTVFSIGSEWTLVTEIGSRFRFGLTPAINAAGVLFVLATIVFAVGHAVLDRRKRAG
jgi:spermidine/putrescine transport system permease protein